MIDSLLKLIFCPKIIAKALDIVIIPKPPICISVRIIICPNKVKCIPVSYTINPVTQVAEVEVNTAPSKEVSLPAEVAAGSMSRRDPMNIVRKKVIITNTGGLSDSLSIIVLLESAKVFKLKRENI